MRSIRISPRISNGGTASWPIEKVAGSHIVYTCPPEYIGELMGVKDKLKGFEPDAIYEEPPKATLEKLCVSPIL